MSLEKAYIPYGGYWSSPFARWQGTLGTSHSLKLAADTTRSFLEKRGTSPEVFDTVHLGMTVPQTQSFYGAPWLAGLIGAEGVTGPTVSQACATSARVLAGIATEVEFGQSDVALGVCCDRTSNGPHLLYPNPEGIGGKGDAEEWVWDNFNKDPHAKGAMINTAENVAKEAGITREEQDELTLIRHKQYESSLENDREFQKRYMVDLTVGRGKRAKTFDADEGVFPTTADGLAGLKPVLEDGTVTFGGQTHPADGNAGIIVCSEERARELSGDSSVTIRVRGYGTARVKKAHMPMAVVPAARAALENVGWSVEDLKAIKTHNPFAVNDVYFSREMGIPFDGFNNNGSPLIYGHPQGPTGLRAIIELIEELVAVGGGKGLFAGCAAGDTAMSVAVEVS